MKKIIPEKIVKLLTEIGETKASALWDCHGTPVILHKALEKIAEHLNITFDDFVFQQLNSEKKICVVSVRGHLGTKSYQTTGEATPFNNKNSYPVAMAEKRAVDRCILKLIGVSGDVYSEEEADDFKKSRPTNH
eukprot:SAG11_NODE_148_length_14747_cov_217.933517_24_plen_134_part_00